ncbi:MAG: amidase [Alphaproteobacteria bacterium]|nr:amidase [Alphaproteobacteria bacterium]
MAATQITDLTLVELANAIRARAVSSREATDAVLARAASMQPRLNCFIWTDPEGGRRQADAADAALARGEAHGPLHGVPLAHKDMFFRKGRVSTCGTKILRETRADTDCTLLLRLDAAGAIEFGGLNQSEFAFGPAGQNLHWGDCRNPWDTSRITAGSSSGSGCAVAGRVSWGALGSDTGGSIRLPAAACGVVGIKPTQTRVSRHGVMGISFSTDTVGPLARTVRDCARLFGVIAGHDPLDPTSASLPTSDYEGAALRGAADGVRGLRVGVPTSYYNEKLDPAVQATWEAGLRRLAEMGAVLVDVPMPYHHESTPLVLGIMTAEAVTLHEHFLKTRPQDYAPQVRARIEPGFAMPAKVYLAICSVRPRLIRGFCETVFSRCDVVFTPAMQGQVPTIAEVDVGDGPRMAETLGRISDLMRPLNFLGLPGLVLPGGFDGNGMPIGMHIFGPPFAEARLFRVGAALEAATGLAGKAPPA